MSNRRQNRRENRNEEPTLDEGELSEHGRRIVNAITIQLNELRNKFRERLAEKDRDIFIEGGCGKVKMLYIQT